MIFQVRVNFANILPDYVFYNIEVMCELGSPTNTQSGELCQMIDMPKLIFQIFVIHKWIQVSRYIVQNDV